MANRTVRRRPTKKRGASDQLKPTPRGVEIGARIKALREARGLTQQALAWQCGITMQMVWRYEHGASIAKADTLAKLADALNTTIQVLLGSAATGNAA